VGAYVVNYRSLLRNSLTPNLHISLYLNLDHGLDRSLRRSLDSIYHSLDSLQVRPVHPADA
jgi:hypothetical protein